MIFIVQTVGIALLVVHFAICAVGGRRAAPCDCGRRAVGWWDFRDLRHPRAARWWWARSIVTPLLVVTSVPVSLVSVIIWGAATAVIWAAHWRHSRRRRRQVLRQLGRVIVDARGRLRIQPLPAPA